MVNLMTTYDSSLKKKIFVLKGDESYTRTTDTILNVVEFPDSFNHIYEMRLGLEINVLRDLGESNIVIYNNGEIIRNIPWSDTPSELELPEDMFWDVQRQVLVWGFSQQYAQDKGLTVNYQKTGLFLPYDLEHNFFAKYMGSKQCLKSESKTYSYFKETPPLYVPSIVINSQLENTSWSLDDSLWTTIRLEADSNVTKHNCTLKVYIDGNYQKSLVVSLNSNYTVDLGEGESLDEGLHTLRIVFDGDDELVACSAETTFSVGRNIQILRADMPLIPAQQLDYNMVDVSVTDWFGRPISNSTIQVWLKNIYKQGVTDSQGRVSINMTDIHLPLGNQKIFATDGVSGSEYYDVFVYLERDIVFFMKSEPSITSIGGSANVTVYAGKNINNPFIGFPIYFSNGEMVRTDNNGNATIQVESTGEGIRSIGASFFEWYDSVQLDDTLVYWNSTQNSYQNEYYELKNADIEKLNNGVRVSAKNVGTGTLYLKSRYYELSVEESWECKFKLVNCYSGKFQIQGQSISAKNGDMITIQKLRRTGQLSLLRIFVNNNLVHTHTQKNQYDGYPNISSVCEQSGNATAIYTVTIDQVKIYKKPIDWDGEGA